MSMMPNMPPQGAPANSPARGSMAPMEAGARHTMDVNLDGKASQQDAQYQPQAPDPTKACAECAHFIDPKACQLVAGDIAPQGTCMMFEPETNESPTEDQGDAPGADKTMPAPTGMTPGAPGGLPR